EARTFKLVRARFSSEEKITSYSYDKTGRIVTITKPDGTVINHTYDALSRLVKLQSSDNTVYYSYSYDLNNNPIEVQDAVSGLVTKRSYDHWNRLLTDGIDGKFSVKYSYDSLGRPTLLQIPDGSSVRYIYSARIESIERYSASERLEYRHRYSAFDRSGRVLESELIGDLGRCTFAWDKKGRNVGITTPHFWQNIPTDGFDAVGNLKKCHFKDVKGDVDVECAYDDLYQLIEETGVQHHTYSNDSVNNRLSKNYSNYVLDSHNRVLSDNHNSFSYDKNGNLLQDATNSYSYDALDRLTAVQTAHGTTRYAYDSFNRRIKKNDDYSIYQGLREIGTYTNGKVTEFRVLGLGKGAELGATVAIELNGKVYCPVHDYRGNIVCLIDSANKVAESYRYTAFGECETSSHQQMSTNPWLFASKRFDPETGFSYFLHRYYAPQLGRWITPDPLGFADGPNIYSYVHNNPMTAFDLYGLFMEDEDLQGRSDLALAAFAHGMAEEFIVGTHSLLCMMSASERYTEVLERGTPDEAYNAFIHSFQRTSAPVTNAADSIRANVLNRMHAADNTIDFGKYHTAGGYATLITGAAVATKSVVTSGIKYAKGFKAVPHEASKTSGAMFKNANKAPDTASVGYGLPKDHMWIKSSPFKDKTADELHHMFLKKGLEPKGPDPKNGLGSYIHPESERQYRIDPKKVGRYDEPNHIDVSRPDKYNGPLGKKRFKYKDD
ncbi:MAG: hypothetical protein JSS12_11205, partial [Verrucomicrobia bacterium]|nr:hypothetical protein [Verrucomicrobiota bacterium]